MEVKNYEKLEEAQRLIDRSMDLINDAIALEDRELSGPLDLYNQLNDVHAAIDELLNDQPEPLTEQQQVKQSGRY